jgi:hypothetical protein
MLEDDPTIEMRPRKAGLQREPRLVLGDFARGWQGYEYGTEVASPGNRKRSFAQPRWFGPEEISGKTLLLHAEQGYGDTIQFATYLLALVQLKLGKYAAALANCDRASTCVRIVPRRIPIAATRFWSCGDSKRRWRATTAPSRSSPTYPSLCRTDSCSDTSRRFHKTALDEFYRVAFRKKIYRSIAELQEDLEAWIGEYNETRSHQGRWCFGKTPMQTFLDAIPMTREKNDRCLRTSDIKPDRSPGAICQIKS